MLVKGEGIQRRCILTAWGLTELSFDDIVERVIVVKM